ncbi:MAG: aconitate hydratase AcnA [Rickettsiaceae bacterium]|nr:aconitate hydratase AcnA [Rickettsiaceae bacterium]
MDNSFENDYKKTETFDNKKYDIYDIKKAATDAGLDLTKLPYSLRVLFENVVRNSGTKASLEPFKNWLKNKTSDEEINYYPARVLMQDFTGVPAIVDLASMRDAMKKIGGNPDKINPMIPVDLVIDHSVQVDKFGDKTAFAENVKKEFERNRERYEFLRWGQESFSNFRVVPPGTGICHQVNLEYLAQTIWLGGNVLYPDTLVGTDSHTTMINALAVLGWGVGGIEAEAAMLGQPLPMILPEVVGFRLAGKIEGNVTATDLVLKITEMLRQKGVVGKFVEFFGSGLDNLALADRATISNMAPEYGATCGFFPIDNETIRYLEFTGRDSERVKIVSQYAKMQNLWRDDNEPEYTDILELNIADVKPSLAGPKRPQDIVDMNQVKENFHQALPKLTKALSGVNDRYQVSGENYKIGNGDVVIAAITSCTNTSNPSVMLAAGIVAKKACEKGLQVKPWVKTSLAPGSQVVTAYLKKGGFDEYLDNLGFNLVGYGCTTCIGNSGPLPPEIDKVIQERELAVASVLSGNRNFEGRVHPHVRANYLASPPLVVAYAIAGTVNINLDEEPLAQDKDGKDVFLKDLWPTQEEIKQAIELSITPQMFTEKYQDVFKGDADWQNIAVTKSDTYSWNSNSTYINNPPYFINIDQPKTSVKNIEKAKILALFGDSITTDHISPAGVISRASPAAKFLLDKGVSIGEFNSYGSRRGNHEVMMRGTFANVRIKNELCAGVEGGYTINHFTGDQTSIYDAAVDYMTKNIPLVIFAGKEYGTGSSRDWAAKGTNLLGVKAVIAESFERIHRSNLVGMGVLPIALKDTSWKNLNLTGAEEISILGLEQGLKPYQNLQCVIKNQNGSDQTFDVTLQVYTDNEVEYIKHGSILEAVIKNLHSSN